MDEADGGTAERVGDHHLCAGVPLDAVVEFAELLAPSVQPTVAVCVPVDECYAGVICSEHARER